MIRRSISGRGGTEAVGRIAGPGAIRTGLIGLALVATAVLVVWVQRADANAEAQGADDAEAVTAAEIVVESDDGSIPVAPMESVMTREQVESSALNKHDVEQRADSMGYDIDTAELVMRIEAAAGPARDMLARSHPDAFGGLWLNDGANPGLTVALVRGADEADLKSTLRNGFSYPELVTFVEVDRSLSDLNADMDRLSYDPDLFPEWANSGMIALDELDNRIVVTLYVGGQDEALRSSLDIYRDDLRGRYPEVPIAVETDDGQAFELTHCVRANCQWLMRGGLQLVHNTDACSTGFNVTKNNQVYMVTAGHCSAGLNTWWRNGLNGHYGRVAERSFADNRDEDAEIVRWESNPWITADGFLGNSNVDIRAVSAFSCWNCYVINQWSGLSGGYGGTTKGRIISTNITIVVADPWTGANVSIRELVQADFCAIGWPAPVPGDSGGAVFRGTVAQGIFNAASSCTFAFSRQFNINEHFDVGVIGG